MGATFAAERHGPALGPVSGPLFTICALVVLGSSTLWMAPLAASTPVSRRGWTPSALTLLAELRSAAFDDLDRNGVLDLVLTTDEFQACFANDGHGTFAPSACQPIAEPAAGHCSAFAVGDVDADRLPDLVIATGGCQSLAVLVTRSKGGFALVDVYPLGLPIASLQVRDVDGDEHPDLVVSSGESDRQQLLCNRGDGRFEAPIAGASSRAH